MKQTSGRAAAAFTAIALLAAYPSMAQSGRGDWAMAGNDPGQSGWQKGSGRLSPGTVPDSFKFLWKIQLGKPEEVGDTFTAPLLASRLINAQGFKDIVYWTSSNTLYAVDSELGTLLWSKKYASPRAAHKGCAAPSLAIAIEPPLVTNLNARRAPGIPAPAPAPTGPVAPNERRLGAPAGGGGFGLKGIYILTHDGMLHEQVLTTGADFAPPVRFLPTGAAGRTSGLAMQGRTIYAASGLGCQSISNALWSIDVGAPGYPVSSFALGKIASASITGPAVAPDGTTLVFTGPSGGPAAVRPNSVVALGPDMKPSDWYTPARSTATTAAVTPAAFVYKGKNYVVAPGGDGSVVLLESSALGGADHGTPLASTASFSAQGAKHNWDGFATYVDRSGTAWVYASISARLASDGKSATTDGPTPHGGIVALRVDDADGAPVLTPMWISRDLVNPAPPALAGGVLAVLAGGDRSAHAVLYILNAATGKELFSSGDQITSFLHQAGLSVAGGKVIFGTFDGTVYCYGLK